MHTSAESSRQGHRLLQAGILLFLLSLFVGILIPNFTVPRVALSTHLLGIMQGIFLMVTGVVWPRLRLARAASRIGFSLAVYGCFSAWTGNLLAGVWGAGNALLPMAAGTAHGTPVQEIVIAAALRPAAVSLILVAVLILWGLRGADDMPG